MNDSGAHCAIDGLCIQDYNYGPNEDCVFEFTGSGTLERVDWGVEAHATCDYDYLQVGGQRYCGEPSNSAAFPTSMDVTGTTRFTWHSDGGAEGTGFKLCARTSTARQTARLVETTAHNSIHVGAHCRNNSSPTRY